MSNDQGVAREDERETEIRPVQEGDIASAHAANAAPERAVADTIFDILVATMWSDGDLTEEEVTRGRVAARALQISPRTGGAFGAIANGAIAFGDIAFDRIHGTSGRLAYATAEWVAAANTAPSAQRDAFLRALKVRLSISDDDATGLRDLAVTLSTAETAPAQALARLMGVVIR